MDDPNSNAEAAAATLARLAASTDAASGAAAELTKKLEDTAKQQAAASAANDKATKETTSRFQAVNDAVENIVSNMLETTSTVFTKVILKDLPQMTESIWTAEKAFDSLTPAVSLVGNALKETISLIGEKLGSFTLFGFGLGEIPKGVAKVINLAIDGMTQSITWQLKSTQQVFDAFTAASAAGGTFGASLTQFSNDAAEAGIPMQMFSKVITDNITKLASFNTSIATGATRVSGLAKTLIKGDPQMIALYGNFNNLSNSVADYLELQAILGAKNANFNDKNYKGLEEYLVRQKELSGILGKNSDLLKQEEAERRKKIDYNLKMGRLSDTAQQNVSEFIEIAGKTMGDTGKRYAEEYFRTAGKVVTPELLEFASSFPASADLIAKALDPAQINKDKIKFRESLGGFYAEFAPIAKQYIEGTENLAELNGAANNRIITMQSEAAGAMQSSLAFMQNYAGIMNENERRRMLALAGGTDTTSLYQQMAIQQLNTQNAIDQMVKNNLANMPTVAGKADELRQKLIQQQIDSYKDFTDAFMGLKNLTEAATDYAKQVMKKSVDLFDIFESAKKGVPPVNKPTPNPTQTQTETPSKPPPTLPTPEQPPPKDGLAVGGLTNGPTLAGEDGVEAVIPLAKGNVPLDIDFTPLLKEMKQTRTLMEELVRTMDDSKDIQRQLLNASY